MKTHRSSYEHLDGQPKDWAAASAVFDFEALHAAPLVREPFSFIVVPNFIRPAVFQELARGFPKTPGPGSFPREALNLSGIFQNLLEQLEGAAFHNAIEAKFGIDLAGRPKMLTLRGQARQKDGSVHTDSKTKLVSVLVYMNDSWHAEGGRLRLLRSQNLDDTLCEIAPAGGTLVAFQRCAVSWHGHKPYAGQRQVIQLNWMTESEAAAWQQARHMAAACVKKIAHLLLR